jgi:spore germination protein YaaH
MAYPVQVSIVTDNIRWCGLAAGLALWAFGAVAGSSTVVLGYYSTDYPLSFEALTNYPALTAVSTDCFILNAAGDLTGDVPQNVLAYARSRKLAVYACVSNDNWDSKIVHRNITRRQAVLVAGLVQLVSTNGYAGVNIDFEGLNPADRAAFSGFIRALAAALHGRGLQLVISVPAETANDPADTWSGAFDYATLGQAADFLQMMTYDETVAGDDPGPVAGLDWMTRCVRYAVTQVPPAKLWLGLPAYARDWRVKTKRATEIDWAALPAFIRKHNGVLAWDAASASGYFDYWATDGKHAVWCETAKGLQLKSAFVPQFHLGGISFWALGMEDGSFRQAVLAGLGN